MIAIILRSFILESNLFSFSGFKSKLLDMADPIKISLAVKDFNLPTLRIDAWVTEAIKESKLAKQVLNKNNYLLSRSRIKNLIETKNIDFDGVIIEDPSFKIKSGKIITVSLPEIEIAIPLAEKINLDILFEDEHLIVLNKKAGMVVHPAPGSPNKTLVNALLYHCGESLLGIGGVKRPGIVHRLDKNTSGVMVAAKTETAHIGLSNIFANHDIDRNYNAIVWGQPEDKGIIEKPIGRSPINRKKMAISPKGKLAITKWKILYIYPPYASLVECKLETGRTHQIRVHMSYLGYSIIGDDLYEKPMSQKRHKNNIIKEKLRLIRSFNRQALHASKLCFQHPVTKKYLEFISSLPQDMKNLIENIKK